MALPENFDIADYFSAPKYGKGKGSLYLNSKRVNYGRAVLNSGWHEARESEPKDHDISKVPVRDMFRSTYDRIATLTDGSIPQTTYQSMTEQVFLKPDYEVKEYRKQMINVDTVYGSTLERKTGRPLRGYGSALPHHRPDFDKFHDFTSYIDHYRPILPAIEKPAPPAVAGGLFATKLCLSQFTDQDKHRRPGVNTWFDESGHYANSHLKAINPLYRRRVPPFLTDFDKLQEVTKSDEEIKRQKQARRNRGNVPSDQFGDYLKKTFHEMHIDKPSATGEGASGAFGGKTGHAAHARRPKQPSTLPGRGAVYFRGGGLF